MSLKSVEVRVLLVCLGNICRSPTAHAVLQKLIENKGLSEKIKIDSAGTGAYHHGEPPDGRATEAANARGYDLSPLRARQVSPADFDDFDYILAMDSTNLRDLRAISPQPCRSKLSLFLDFSHSEAKIGGVGVRDVPDPYYSGGDGFELVLDLVEEASAGLIEHIEQQDLSES